MKTYDLVKQILEEDKASRDSDKRLMFMVWNRQGLLVRDRGDIFLSWRKFKDQAIMPESITRARRKVIEHHPELEPISAKVKTRRKERENTKGLFAVREDVEKGIYK